MPSRTIIGLAIASLLVLAACGSSTTSPAASTAASTAPSTAASPAAGGAVCSETKDAFAFNPAAVTAKVGQVIAFTNNDTTAHTATLDAGGCTTPNIAPATSDGLVFTAAGTYPFHCSIHSQMKGTITVTS